MRVLLFVAITAWCVCQLLCTEAATIASFKKGEGSDAEGFLAVHGGFLRQGVTASIPLYNVVSGGKQGVGKSTTDRALGMSLGIKDADFRTCNALGHCTKDVQMSSPSGDGITFLDQPGQQKGGLDAGLNLSSDNVDLMLAQIVIPVSNIIMQVCADSINESDLQILSMYSDERMHAGELGSQRSNSKPELIIVLKTDRSLELNEGVHLSEEQYLASVIPANSPLRKTFNSIKLVLMPVVYGEEKALLSNDNFHPEQIPKYWAAIQTLKTMILDMAAKVPASARWTGSEIATVLEKMLPSVNAHTKTDLPTMRSALLLQRVSAALITAKPALVAQFNEHVRDPFRPAHVSSLPTSISAARAAAEESLLKQFRGHESEVTIWPQIKAAVTTALDDISKDILKAAEDQKRGIIGREQTAVDAGSRALTAAKNSLTYEGVGATVDQTLVSKLRVPITAFQASAVLPNVTPSSGYADKLKRLKDEAVALWKSAHDANYAAWLTKRQSLQGAAGPTNHENVNERIHSCGNERHERKYDLRQRFPQYFGDGVRANLHSVRADFDGSGGGGGNFNLNPAAGEPRISRNGMDGGKYLGNEMYYNAGNTVLRVILQGGGWGRGRCRNTLEMHKVALTIVRNKLALPENAVYNTEYQKAGTPVF